MGEEGKRMRWCVTYTKHLKQKRKVYQDGFLLLLPNININKAQVMLYDDEMEQLLESMFLTKHDLHLLHPGNSIQFPSFLVDISHLLTQPISNTYYTNINHLKQASSIKLTPSHTIINEFKKNQLLRYSIQHSPSTPSTPPSFQEWEALYTAQITRKSKKYHDGFLRLLTCGSRHSQIVLYDLNKNQLDKRFLKKDEIISEGESMAFDSYLVEIGGPVGGSVDDVDVKMQGVNCKLTDGREKVAASCGSSAGHPEQDASVESNMHSLKVDKMDVRRRLPCHKPLRDAYQILSMLKKPVVAQDRHPENPAKQYSESVQLDGLCKDAKGSLAVPIDPRTTESKDRKKVKDEGYIASGGNQPQVQQHFDLPTTPAVVVNADKLCNKVEMPASSQKIKAKYSAVEYCTKIEQEVESSPGANSDHTVPTCTVANLVSRESKESEAAYQDQRHTSIPESSDVASEGQVVAQDVSTTKCSSTEMGNLAKVGKSQPILDYPSFDLGF